MGIVDIAELKSALAPGQRVLGLDLGEKTIGLALSDTALIIATPMETIRRRKFTGDAARLEALIAEQGVGALVLGLPFNMDGSEGPRCQSVRQFAANLLGRGDLAIAFWDERLSTAAVTRTLLEADVSRRKRRDVIDKMAASYILQGALDRIAMI